MLPEAGCFGDRPAQVYDAWIPSAGNITRIGGKVADVATEHQADRGTWASRRVSPKLTMNEVRRFALVSVSLADMPIRDLIALVGPEHAAALANPSATDLAAIDAFGKRIASMTDEQLRTEIGASDDWAAALRELQTLCGF
jgi:hypothetical protein